METLQKTLSKIRELQDEELDLVGGLAGCTYVLEEFEWCNRTNDGHTFSVIDSVKTSTGTD
jgi:hypothetical protein